MAFLFSNGADRDGERPQDGAVVGALVVRGSAPEAFCEPYVHRSLQRIAEGRDGIAGSREERAGHRNSRTAVGRWQVWMIAFRRTMMRAGVVLRGHTVRAFERDGMRFAVCVWSTIACLGLPVGVGATYGG
jgi:hypothetical protein